MKKIIVTGCNGQLGRAINKELAGNAELEFVNTDVGELDITNIDKVMALAREVKPYAIINCAAHTAVDACETDVDNAYRINAIGPRNLSIAATETKHKRNRPLSPQKRLSSFLPGLFFADGVI